MSSFNSSLNRPLVTSCFATVGILCLLWFAGCEVKDATSENVAVKVELEKQRSSEMGWPAIYGPNQDSISRESEIELQWNESGPPVKWRRNIGTGYSTPLSVDDQTFVLYRKNDEEILECLNAETGQLNWDFRRATTFVCGWESYSSGPYSTPVVNDQYLFFVSAQGMMYCLARDTGDLVWSRNLFSDYQLKDQKWPVVTSPALLSDRLIFNLGASDSSAGIVALDIHDGSTIWQATDHAASHCTPLIADMHGRKLAFVLTAGALVCLDPATGNVFWSTPQEMNVADEMFGNAVTPIKVNDKILIVSGPHVRPGFRCLKINPDLSVTEPWENIRLLNTQYTNLIANNGHVFGMKGAGSEMRCVDIRTGKLAWKSAMTIGRSNGIAVGDFILLLGERGHLAAMEINFKKLVIRWQTAEPLLAGPCYSPMALNQGLLYLRNDREIVCLNLRRKLERPPIVGTAKSAGLKTAGSADP